MYNFYWLQPLLPFWPLLLFADSCTEKQASEAVEECRDLVFLFRGSGQGLDVCRV